MGVDTLEWVEVAAEADIGEGQLRAVQVSGKRVLVTVVEGTPYALGAICSHERANLDEGTLMGHELYCPLHFSCFDVRTGEALAPPADKAVAVYAVKVEDGKVLVSTAPVDPEALEDLATAAPSAGNGAPTPSTEPEAAAEAPEAPEAAPEATEPEAAAEPADAGEATEAAPAAADGDAGKAAEAAPETPEAPGGAPPEPEPVAAPKPAAAREPVPAKVADIPRTRVPEPTTLHAKVLQLIDRQEWLESGAQWLGTTLRPVRESRLGGRVFDLLHGRLTGHALHPALSDVPIGFWSGAVLLRTAGQPDPAALLAGAGVAAGLGTAASGVADWTVSDGGDRRVGLFHGITQTVALGLVGGSVALHAKDRPTGSAALLVTGTGVSLASAYLGGHLVLGRGLMVDHTAWTRGPRRWTPTIELSELGEGEAKPFEVDGRMILVSRIDGTVSAIENACTHAGGPLAMGRIENGTVTCPWHGSCFKLSDGSVVRGPAQHRQPMLETRVRDGRVEVRGRAH